MSWFGWLEKGALDVSVLDRIVMGAEIFVAIGVVGLCALTYEKIKHGRKQ